MNTPPPPAERPLPPTPANPGPSAILLKVGATACLVLLLLIPLRLVQSVLRERLARRDQAVEEITSSWGAEQILVGPVLIVPYRYAQQTWKDQAVGSHTERVSVTETVGGRAFFLPVTFEVEGRLEPLRLHRGIYETVVYDSQLTLRGRFARPSFAEENLPALEILWGEAELAVSVTDLRGTKEALSVKLADQTIPLKPGSRLEGLSGVYARSPGLANLESIPFEMSLTFNGSRTLRFAPIGENNDVRLNSTWPDPSFQGAFLPAERDTGPEGFRAHWQVSYYGRGYPQQWTDRHPIGSAAIAGSLFGVNLVSVVDSYRLVERAIKYGILFIVLIFTAFFLFEVRAAIRIHPFQYTLVGFALCLFYLALLALSEFVPFGLAYWTGASISAAMIALYCAKALGLRRRAGVVWVGLLATYGFLFVILRLQDYSLLLGAAGLVFVLAAVMWVTRNIDWYGSQPPPAPGLGPDSTFR